jgi:ubiquitin-conjugating enzyme E2 Q
VDRRFKSVAHCSGRARRLHSAAEVEKDNHPNQVKGVDYGWLQFHFVPGTLEKEQRFRSEVDAYCPRMLRQHSSLGLGNWHGIVSEGVEIDRMANGRSYGNGVYLGSTFAISVGYSQDA